MRLLARILLAAVLTALMLVGAYLLLIRPGQDSLMLGLGGHELALLAPRWLLLLCLAPLVWLLQSGTLVDLSRLQQALSLLVRTLLLAALALALARPSITSMKQRICTVVLVDVSDSISDDQLKAARKMVQRAWDARGENELRLLTFAARPTVIPLGQKTLTIPPLVRHRGTGAGERSDIQGAIQHAYGLFPSNLLRRMVLITDGNETDGDLLAEAHRAAERGIRIHGHTLPERRSKEILVRALQLPTEVRMGAPFDLTAEIHSTHKDSVTLTLFKDEFINGLEGRKTVSLQPGRNVVRFKSMVRDSGTVSYRLVMSRPAHDTWRANNTASAILPVFGRPRVLYVEGEPLFAGHLKRALEAEKIDVETRGPHGVPASATQLSKYDLLILSDVPAMYVGPGQMGAIASYVRDLGGGFIMAGGPNAFGAGGYYGTQLEKILPVRMDTEKKRDQPSLGLVLCIDRSGSMTGMKLELAKEAARATAELLGGSDLIGVVAFDSTAQVVVRLQRAAYRLRILNDIARLAAGGGTSIRPALQEALVQLQPAPAKVKHVILLSDGQSDYGGIQQLVDEMVQSRITVSAVGVGSGADRTLLQMIAERGNGRFYHTNDPSSIPKIFTKETTQVARSALVEEAIRVHVLKMASVISGIDWGSAPALLGYVSTKAKPTSETLLVSHHGEPILSLWRVGLGKTAAFTSDVKNRWAAAWLRWPGFVQLWGQMVREVMRHRIQRSFEMRARVQEGVVKVEVDALTRSDRFINGLDSSLTVMDPGRPGRKRTLPLNQTAAGRYETEFRLPHYGSWLLRATHKLDGKTIAESIATLAAPYPSEYTHLVQNRSRVRRAVLAAGGRIDPAPRVVFDPDGEQIRYHRELWPWVLYLVIGLFVLDIFFRRVRIFGYRTDF